MNHIIMRTMGLFLQSKGHRQAAGHYQFFKEQPMNIISWLKLLVMFQINYYSS